MTALVVTVLAVLVVAGLLLTALTHHHHRQENPMPELPPPPSDVPLALTTDVVDQLLAQVERNRAVGYWQADEHRDTLAGAETWLSSLRDWLAAGGQAAPMPEGPAWEPLSADLHAWVVYDYDSGPYAIALHGTAEDAARDAARRGYGKVGRWVVGADFADAIREWEGR